MPINTANMNLLLPVIGSDSGLIWEQSTNANTLVLDGHNHTPGNGVQIPPSGLNINASLPFNNQSATGLLSLQFTPQASLATTQSLYMQGVDLYFNDGSGNVVRITSGGTVNATSSGITDGTNTASFVAGVLTVESSTSFKNIAAQSVLLANANNLLNQLTLAAPTLSTSYQLTLPTIPAATSIMQLDSSGNLSASLTVDNATLQNTGSKLLVKAGGIGFTQLATTANGSGIFTGSYSNSSSTPTSICASFAIASVSTRPMFFTFGNFAITITNSSGSSATTAFTVSATGDSINMANIIVPANTTLIIPASAFSSFIIPSAPGNVYSFQAAVTTGSATITAPTGRIANAIQV